MFREDKKGLQDSKNHPMKKSLKKEQAEKPQENIAIDLSTPHGSNFAPTMDRPPKYLHSLASKSNEPSKTNLLIAEGTSKNNEKQSELSTGSRPKYRRQKSNAPIEVNDADTVLMVRNNRIITQTGPHDVKLKYPLTGDKISSSTKGRDALSTITDILPDGLFTIKTGRGGDRHSSVPKGRDPLSSIADILPEGLFTVKTGSYVSSDVPKEPGIVLQDGSIKASKMQAVFPDGAFTVSTGRSILPDAPVSIRKEVLPARGPFATHKQHGGMSYAGQLHLLNPMEVAIPNSPFATPDIDNAERLEQLRNLQEQSGIKKTEETRNVGNISRWFFPEADGDGRVSFGQPYSGPIVGIFPHGPNLSRNDLDYVASIGGYFSKNNGNSIEHCIPKAKTTTNQNMFNRVPLYNRFPQLHFKDGGAHTHENVPSSNSSGPSHPVSSSMVASRDASYYTGQPLIKINENSNSLTVSSNNLLAQQEEIRNNTVEVSNLPVYAGHPEAKMLNSRELYLQSTMANGQSTMANNPALQPRHPPVSIKDVSQDFLPSIATSQAVHAFHSSTTSLQTLQTAPSIVNSNAVQAMDASTVSIQTLQNAPPPVTSHSAHSMYPQISNSNTMQAAHFPFTNALQDLRPLNTYDFQAVRHPNNPESQVVRHSSNPNMQPVRPPAKYFWQVFPPPPIRHLLPLTSQTLPAVNPPTSPTLPAVHSPTNKTLPAVHSTTNKTLPSNRTSPVENPSTSQTLQTVCPTSHSLLTVPPPLRHNLQAVYPHLVGDHTFRAINPLLGNPLQAVRPPINFSLQTLRPPINYTLQPPPSDHAAQTIRPPPLSNLAMQSIQPPLINNYALQTVHPSMINNPAFHHLGHHASQKGHSSIPNSNNLLTTYPPTANSYPMPAGNPPVTAISGFPAHIGQSSSGVYSFYTGFPVTSKDSCSAYQTRCSVTAGDRPASQQPGFFVNPVINANPKKSKTNVSNSKISGQGAHGGSTKPKNVVGLPLHLRKNIRVRFKGQPTTENPEKSINPEVNEDNQNKNAQVNEASAQAESSQIQSPVEFPQNPSPADSSRNFHLGDTVMVRNPNQVAGGKKGELSTLSDMSSCSVSWSSYGSRNTPSPKKDLDMEYVKRLLEK